VETMPIFEFKCKACQRKFSLLLLKARESYEENCPHCQAADIIKLPSCFCVQQSESSRMADLNLTRPRDSEFYKDSRNIGLWAKKRMSQLGVKPSSQMEEVIEKARRGKILDE
jgi:putative FmdB family regulatory protein